MPMRRDIPFKYQRQVQWLLFGMLCTGILWYLFKPFLPVHIVFECSGEELVQRYTEAYFKAGDYALNQGALQTDLQAFSGDYSLLLSDNEHFGWTTEVLELYGGEQLSLSAWRYSPTDIEAGLLVATAGKFWQPAAEITDKDQGWEHVRLQIELPPETKNEILTIYCYNPGADSVYFDDLRLEIQRPWSWKLDLNRWF